MGKKVIQHKVRPIKALHTAQALQKIDAISCDNKIINIVQLNCVLHTNNPMSLQDIHLHNERHIETLIPNHHYLLTTLQWGCNFYYGLKMIDNDNAIIVPADIYSVEILGQKFRWGIQKSYHDTLRQIMISESANNMLVQVGSDPLNIVELSSTPRTDSERIFINNRMSDRINLWDYDAGNPIIKPHIFRLMVQDKLILNKPQGV